MTAMPRAIYFVRRTLVPMWDEERGARRLVVTYSPDTPRGGVCFPWITKARAQALAAAVGAVACFSDTPGDRERAIALNTPPAPACGGS